MAVVVARSRPADVAALAALIVVAGLLAAPAVRAGQARQSGQRRPVTSTWQRDVLRLDTARRSKFAPIPARSLWRPGGLAHGGLPRMTGPVGGVAAAVGWRVQPTPNPATLRNASPQAVSCSAAGDCTAVGVTVSATGADVTLAERLKGSSWHLQSTPAIARAAGSLFTGVSCTAANACVAVGYYFGQSGRVFPLAERWNGATWRRQSPVGTGQDSGFFAVSCTSATACTAVGTSDPNSTTSVTLAERWDGTRWRIQSTPAAAGAVNGTLLGVSCSGPKACTAVGASGDLAGTSTPLAMRWNGSSWTLRTTQVPAGATGSGLSAVGCSAAGACTAAGSYDTNSGATLSLAERWNGVNWVIQSVPSPAGAMDSELLTVSCISASACTAGGDYLSTVAAARGHRPDIGNPGPVLTLAETWNGSAWQVQGTPNPAGNIGDGFAGLSCVTSGACAAVGSYGTTANLSDLALAEAWNGTNWTVQASANPSGANPSQLSADSCVTARDCVAVGSYAKNTTVTDTLAESWNGSRWRIEATPNPAGQTFSALGAISCATARSCVAVGASSRNQGNPAALAENWNGSKWTIRKVPEPAHNSGVTLTGVSCTAANACTAVGFYSTHSGTALALAERWNGAKWRIQKLPTAAKQTTFASVWCTSARACIAVGFLSNHAGDARPLAEAWTGGNWTVRHVPVPKGAPGGLLSSVGCSAARDCTATGTGFASNGEPLAERWNGAKWTAESTVPPPSFESSTSQIFLGGVSCSSSRTCTAVGGYTPGNQVAAFGEGWNGIKWRLQPTAAPAVSLGSILGGLSCPAPKCIAVGADIGIAGIVTLAESRPA